MSVNIVLVKTQYIREAGFNARLSLFFCVILKKTRKIFVVSKIITMQLSFAMTTSDRNIKTQDNKKAAQSV
jgi:hypothetical protein